MLFSQVDSKCLFSREIRQQHKDSARSKASILTALEMVESTFQAHGNTVRGSRRHAKKPEDNASDIEQPKAFIKEEVTEEIYKDVFPCSAEKFFDLLLSDDSKFTTEYRTARKDSKLLIGQWHEANECDGRVREITFRSLCNSPMCPPETAMTEHQHVVLLPDKKTLVLETVQLAHDVPFGSFFEVHSRWHVQTIDDNSCTIDIKVGVHFKKWCMMHSTIKMGTITEYKKDLEAMLEMARSFVKPDASRDEADMAALSTSIAGSSS
ncbi:hypothetical protein MLD38_012046 [Melastoma candidum]|uniref:Uncharacterized protein n=1 Tax=Melastoma candidum TaxID=119954 RepID=A0ACB9R531_9MYRT|nr:hypothetical protein MLD38_012046 [Melastoma candidum]